MKYIILLLLAIPAHALDLTLPETPFDYQQMEEDSMLIQDAINNRLRIFKVKNEPTKRQLRTFYILNAIDMTTSYHMTSTNPNIKESNFLLAEKPTAAEFLLHKSVTTPLAAANLEEGQIVVVNWFIAAVILKNIYLYNTTCKTLPNYHHITGENLNSC